MCGWSTNLAWTSGEYEMWQVWKTFLNYGCDATPISKNSTPEAVGMGHQGPRRADGARRLRGRERRAAARTAVEIGDTSEEAVNVNESTPTWVSKGNWTCWVCWKYWEIREYNQSFWDFNLHFGSEEAEETNNLENSFSDKNSLLQKKIDVIVKG